MPPGGTGQASNALKSNAQLVSTRNGNAAADPGRSMVALQAPVANDSNFSAAAASGATSLAHAQPIKPGPDIGEFEEKGRASWYGRGFHGRKTASGETYNMNAMTAAHRTLPLASWVRVTNQTNQKSVVVKINDRGPYARGRIIDLSYAAAAMLGMRGSGVSSVKIEGLTPQEAREAREQLASNGSTQ
jgi:rare lipoprotein A